MSEISWDKHQILRLVPAAAIISFVGLCDDLFGLRAWLKLAVQIAAAGMAVWTGLMVDFLSCQPMNVIVSTAVTVFWLVLCKSFILCGEPGGNRTHDRRLKRALLYQLSYELSPAATQFSHWCSDQFLR
jgi:hypothetical protein